MLDEEYYKKYRKKWHEELKQVKQESRARRKNSKSVHVTAKELHNVLKMINEES